MYRKWKRQQNANSCCYLHCPGTPKLKTFPAFKKERQSNIPDGNVNRIQNYEEQKQRDC